jgi:predicted nuclease of restriction endonuclease-like (RecB) superfamily
MPRKRPDVPGDYVALLAELKSRITAARLKAAVAVNSELILLYWQIGDDILRRQRDEGWGAKVVDRLAADLRRAFPEMKGLSARNLKYMRAFAEACPDRIFVQQVAAQLPWGHTMVLLDKVKNPDERQWYMRQTTESGWSRNVLLHQIESELYQRQGKALTNFTRTLPAKGLHRLSAAAVRAMAKPGHYADGGGLHLQVSRFDRNRGFSSSLCRAGHAAWTLARSTR